MVARVVSPSSLYVAALTSRGVSDLATMQATASGRFAPLGALGAGSPRWVTEGQHALFSIERPPPL